MLNSQREKKTIQKHTTNDISLSAKKINKNGKENDNCERSERGVIYMAKTTAAQRATAADPETANLFREAALGVGEGASDGTEEIVDGVTAGDEAGEEVGVVAGGGAGGEFNVTGDGAGETEGVTFDGGGEETGVFAGGGEEATGGDLVGEEAGDDDGD